LLADPQFDAEQLAKASTGDTNDALYELSGFFKVSQFRALVMGTLFVEFDAIGSHGMLPMMRCALQATS
jgi:hypothetical protein